MNPHADTVITLALVDDHQLMRDGLRHILSDCADLEVIAEAAEGHTALVQARQCPPRVMLVDISLPVMTGIELTRRIRSELPQVRVLMLTMHADAQHAVRALRAGASGYLTKDCSPAELVAAIRKVATGGAYLPAGMADRVAMELNGQDAGAALSQLSNRELQVLELLLAGRRVTDIAEALHLSVKTVSTHKTRILEKTGLANVAQLVRYGIEHGLTVAPGSLTCEQPER